MPRRCKRIRRERTRRRSSADPESTPTSAPRLPARKGCTRIEVGLKTGFSGNHLRRSLTNGPQYKVIRATSVPEFTVDGDESFLIPASDGKIHHIRANIEPFLITP